MKKLMFYIITAFALMVSAPMAMACTACYDAVAADTYQVVDVGEMVAVDPTDTKAQVDNDIFASLGSYRPNNDGIITLVTSYRSSDSKVTRNVTAFNEGPGYAGVTAA